MCDTCDLVIELAIDDGTVKDSFRIATKDLLSHAERGYGEVMRRAVGVAADGQEVLRVTYADDEGDMCTLNASTIKDALNFVRHYESSGVNILTLVVVTVAKSTCEQDDSSPIPTDDSEDLEVAAMEVLNRWGCTMDLRKLIPKLASSGLRVFEEFPEPAFFEMLDILLALKEGVANVERIPTLLPQVISAFEQAPADVQSKVLKRFSEEALKAIQELRDEETGTKRSDVEVHMHIICDGCEANPIIGPRYKSLNVDNFDLCQTCYKNEDRDAKQWCQIASPVVGEVVGSYFADAGQPGPDVHHCVECDGCGMHPIVGKRFKSAQLLDYDLCEECHTRFMSDPETRDHRFEEKLLPHRLVAHGAAACAVERAEAIHLPDQEEDSSQPAVEEEPPKADTSPEATVEQAHAVGEALPAASTLQEEPSKADTSAEVAATVDQARVAVELLSASASQDSLRRLLASSSAEVREATAAAILAAAQDDTAACETPTPSITSASPSTCSAEDDWEMAVGESTVVDSTTSEPPTPPRANILDSMPLVTGIEAEEVAGARGDVTQEFAGRGLAASQVYRIGAIEMPAGGSGSVPACATAVVQNNGQVPWPETAALVSVLGHDLGMPDLELGSVKPGDAAEIVLDLLVPPHDHPGTICSAWAILDSATGEHLGPVLLFETRWTE